jgi:hypothetical protein
MKCAPHAAWRTMNSPEGSIPSHPFHELPPSRRLWQVLPAWTCSRRHSEEQRKQHRGATIAPGNGAAPRRINRLQRRSECPEYHGQQRCLIPVANALESRMQTIEQENQRPHQQHGRTSSRERTIAVPREARQNRRLTARAKLPQNTCGFVHGERRISLLVGAQDGQSALAPGIRIVIEHRDDDRGHHQKIHERDCGYRDAQPVALFKEGQVQPEHANGNRRFFLDQDCPHANNKAQPRRSLNPEGQRKKVHWQAQGSAMEAVRVVVNELRYGRIRQPNGHQQQRRRLIPKSCFPIQ